MSLRGDIKTNRRDPRFVAGWWIVPSFVLGGAMWTVLIRAFF